MSPAALPATILAEAAEWYATLTAHAATPEECERWQAWLAIDERHQEAWARVDTVRRQFADLPGTMAAVALRAPSPARRRAAGALVTGCATVLGAWMLLRRSDDPWPDDASLAAAARKLHSGVAQVRTMTMAGGTRVWVNAGSQAFVADVPSRQRIDLRRGEVLVVSGPAQDVDPDVRDAPARDLAVDTAEGRVRALGTRFSVRVLPDGAVRATVFGGSVLIEPAATGTAARQLQAGQSVEFTRTRISAITGAEARRQSWVDGVLVADSMRLDDFLAELAPYHDGYLGCAPEVAHLRLMGVYPLGKVDQVLDMLPASLPVRVHRLTPWWVRVGPA